MCLTKLLPLPKRLPKTGYKVFKGIHSEDLNPSVLLSVFCNGVYKHGVWYKDVVEETIVALELEYPTGYHIFLTRQPAERYCEWWGGWPYMVRKVKFRNTVAYGEQKFTLIQHSHARTFHIKCVVAREMFILREED